MDVTEVETEEVIVITCHWTDPPHFHEYPGDWVFGGANSTHPATDPRWRSTVYTYLDAEFRPVYSTSEYLCDDQAIERFTWVRDSIQGARPKYIMVQRPGATKPIALPWTYNWENDEANEVVSSPSC